MDSTTTPLPPGTISVMVHKHFVERVVEYLLLPLESQIPWTRLKHPLLDSVQAGKDVDTASSSQNNNFDDSITILDITETKGNSHDRQGFQILLVARPVRPIHFISPLARQNIAWAWKISHCCTLEVNPETEEMTEKLRDDIGNTIMDTWPLDFTRTPPLLRVDVHPKISTDAICLGLQRAYHRKYHLQISGHQKSPLSSLPTHPYEDGPLNMTRSASKCSLRLSVILPRSQNMNTSPANGQQLTLNTPKIYWGWMDRSIEHDRQLMEIKLNEFAKKEVVNIAPNHVTGEEVDGVPVSPQIPLSRAYYKLEQVWAEILEPQERETLSQIHSLNASAVDLGSAPGGWTQVLAFRAPDLKAVCSVDQGQVAHRITQDKKVHHIQGVMEASETQRQLQPFHPFAILVCDASQIWSELLDMLVKKVVPNDSGNNNAQQQQFKFTLPCIFVITLKLPYQTPKSIQRHLDLIDKQLPHYLSRMAASMYHQKPVQSRHTVVHLMANSSSERTLIAIFEEHK